MVGTGDHRGARGPSSCCSAARAGSTTSSSSTSSSSSSPSIAIAGAVARGGRCGVAGTGRSSAGAAAGRTHTSAMLAVRWRSQRGVLRGSLLMRMWVVVLVVVVVVRVWVALVLVLGHRGGCGGRHVDVVRMGVAMEAGGGRGGAPEMGGRSRRSCCCGCCCRGGLLVVQDMSVMRVVAVGVMGMHMVGVDVGGSSGMVVVAQQGCGGRSRRRHLVHVQRPLLVLRLGSSQGRLQGHHPLAIRRQAALLASAVAELAVPLVSLQGDLQAVVAAAGAVGRRPGRNGTPAGAGGPPAHVVLRVDHVRVGHRVAVPVLLRNHVCSFWYP